MSQNTGNDRKRRSLRSPRGHIMAKAVKPLPLSLPLPDTTALSHLNWLHNRQNRQTVFDRVPRCAERCSAAARNLVCRAKCNRQWRCRHPLAEVGLRGAPVLACTIAMVLFSIRDHPVSGWQSIDIKPSQGQQQHRIIAFPRASYDPLQGEVSVPLRR